MIWLWANFWIFLAFVWFLQKECELILSMSYDSLHVAATVLPTGTCINISMACLQSQKNKVFCRKIPLSKKTTNEIFLLAIFFSGAIVIKAIFWRPQPEGEGMVKKRMKNPPQRMRMTWSQSLRQPRDLFDGAIIIGLRGDLNLDWCLLSPKNLWNSTHVLVKLFLSWSEVILQGVPLEFSFRYKQYLFLSQIFFYS